MKEFITKMRNMIALNQKISKSDYKALKFVDNELTEKEYSPVREYRNDLREQINKLRGGD